MAFKFLLRDFDNKCSKIFVPFDQVKYRGATYTRINTVDCVFCNQSVAKLSALCSHLKMTRMFSVR